MGSATAATRRQTRQTFTAPLVTKVKLKPARFKRRRGTKLTLTLRAGHAEDHDQARWQGAQALHARGQQSGAKTLSFRIKRPASLRARRPAT
jgi:hypothetical protein